MASKPVPANPVAAVVGTPTLAPVAVAVFVGAGVAVNGGGKVGAISVRRPIKVGVSVCVGRTARLAVAVGGIEVAVGGGVDVGCSRYGMSVALHANNTTAINMESRGVVFVMGYPISKSRFLRAWSNH
jgi:hypothetical protein